LAPAPLSPHSAKESNISRMDFVIFGPAGLPPAFVESAVNEILPKRVIKKQQMRWNRWTLQSFLDVALPRLCEPVANGSPTRNRMSVVRDASRTLSQIASQSKTSFSRKTVPAQDRLSLLTEHEGA
jgi:hypothetical protein